jgi:hypothetical protein
MSKKPQTTTQHLVSFSQTPEGKQLFKRVCRKIVQDVDQTIKETTEEEENDNDN